MMKDIRVVVKVRNNRLLSAIEQAGWDSVPKFCKFVGVSYTSVNDLINMREIPINQDGMLKNIVIKICEELNKTPEQLFSTDQMYHKLDMNKAEVEVSMEDVSRLLTYDSNLEKLEDHEILESAINRLTDRKQFVLRHRMGMDGESKSFDVIAHELGVHRSRVRQIEYEAIQNLKNDKHLMCDLDGKNYTDHALFLTNLRSRDCAH